MLNTPHPHCFSVGNSFLCLELERNTNVLQILIHRRAYKQSTFSLLLYLISSFFFPVPSSVSSFQCEAVANTSCLMLKWDCPYGGYSGFDIEIFNDTWTKNEHGQFCGREGSEESFITEPLDYYKTYTVNITTVSEGLTSLPVQIICNTSITGKH